MNFVADVYIGCPHACWYCYAPSFVVRGNFEASFQGFRNFRRRFKSDSDFEKIESAIKEGNVKGTCNKEQESFISAAIKHRHPLRIGSVSDPFGLPLENQFGDAYRILEILIENNYPFVACTKSPLVATPKYINLLKSADGKAGVQISLISLNENLLGYLESRPGGSTPSAKSRLEALRKLSDEGIFTTCRIQPLIPQVTEYGMQELIFALAEAGVKHVIVEFLWLPMGHAKEMSQKLKTALDAYRNAGGEIGPELTKFNNDINAYYRSFDDVEVAYGRIFYSKRKMAELMPKFAEMVAIVIDKIYYANDSQYQKWLVADSRHAFNVTKRDLWKLFPNLHNRPPFLYNQAAYWVAIGAITLEEAIGLYPEKADYIIELSQLFQKIKSEKDLEWAFPQAKALFFKHFGLNLQK
jgi:DNA repair photolyase